jgi:hypothetical protein
MSTKNRWVALLLALSALTACAATPPAGSAGAARRAASPQRVYVTGSRVAVPVDPHTGLPQTASALQIVSGDDLRSTGQLDVAAALRMLVPAIQ